MQKKLSNLSHMTFFKEATVWTFQFIFLCPVHPSWSSPSTQPSSVLSASALWYNMLNPHTLPSKPPSCTSWSSPPGPHDPMLPLRVSFHVSIHTLVSHSSNQVSGSIGLWFSYFSFYHSALTLFSPSCSHTCQPPSWHLHTLSRPAQRSRRPPPPPPS